MAQRSRGWTIGRVAGVPVVVEPGWVVMAVILVALALPWAGSVVGSGPAALGWALAGVLLLLGSVFLHELAHALVALRVGLGVSRISVTFLGGHTTLGSGASRPGASALVAAVGPATNLVIAAAAWAGGRLAPTGALAVLLGVTALVNVFVGVFNLVPGLPLDGGRVLEAAVWAGTGRRGTGTVAAAWVGRAVAVGVVAWAALPDLLAGREPSFARVIWGVVIAATLWQGATAALRHAERTSRVEALDLAALSAPAVGVPAHGTVTDLAAVGGAAAVLVGPDGVPVALVDAVAAAAVPGPERASTPLAAVALGLPPGVAVPAGASGPEVLAAARGVAATSPVLVVMSDAGPVALVRIADVVAALGGRGPDRA